MMLAFLSPMTLMLMAFVALMMFGPQRLPEIGKALGEAVHGFKEATSEGEKTAVKAPEEK